ncbi:flagellar biosynthetic protein FliO [Massilibacterium senegalense]|uniref:flagellar biosynthetic protein FliO n=1 Tax=Massilibacterium senegalense TaxID=1632858 RepID=UPI000785A65B|nr:flagellar biosynthetic protein FliO [Massilibacterium senegalense]
MFKTKLSILFCFVILVMFPLRSQIAFAETFEFSSGPCNGTVEECLQQNKKSETKQPSKEKIESEAEVPGVSQQSLWGSFLKLIVASVFVIGLLILLLKFINRRTKEFQSGKAMQTLGGISVGNNKSVQLIRLGNEILVVGVGENVQLLKEITEEKTIQTLVQLSENETASSTVPLEKMKQWFQSKKNQDEQEPMNFKMYIKEQLLSSQRERKEIIEEAKKKGKDQ